MAHTAYFKHGFGHDEKAMPGKLVSQDFYHPLDATGPRDADAETFKDGTSYLPGTAQQVLFR